MLSRVQLFQVVCFTNRVRVARILARKVNLCDVVQSYNMASGFKSDIHLLVYTIILQLIKR